MTLQNKSSSYWCLNPINSLKFYFLYIAATFARAPASAPAREDAENPALVSC